MKFIIEKNVVMEVSKVSDELETKAIKYSGYSSEGENIDIYDIENGKLAPIVRYLMEGGEETKGKLLLWLIIGGLIALAITLVIIFSGGTEPVKQVKVAETTKVIPLQSINNKIETPVIVDNLENELRNEVDMMTGLKNEAEIQTLRNTFEIEKKNITIEKLNSKNGDLLEKNNELENELEKLKENIANRTNRVIENTKDGFIYYLGDNVYQKCESATDDKILSNCQELYYKYIKYAENK